MTKPIDPPAPAAAAPPSEPEAAAAPMSRGGWAVCVLAAALAAVVHIGPQWLYRFHLGPDECYMLQTAVRLHRGQGLTSSTNADLSDLAEPRYTHLYHWPPLWCLTAAGLMGVGFDPESVPLILQMAAAFAGALGWMRLGLQVLPAAPAALFGAAAASIWFGSQLGPGDLPFWAMMPWFIGQVLRGWETGHVRNFAFAGVLAAIAVATRYAAVFLIPAGGLTALMAGPASRRARFLRAAAFGLPPVLALGTIFLVNRSAGGSASWVADKGFVWSPENLVSTEPLRFLFADGFGWEHAFYRHWPHLQNDRWMIWPGWYLAMAAAAIAIVLRRPAFPTSQRRFLVLAGLLTLCLLGLLGGLAVSMAADEITPVNEPRYYRELMPAVGLAWMVVFLPAVTERLEGRRRGFWPTATAGVGCVLAVLASLTAYRAVKGAYNITKEYIEEGPPQQPIEEVVRRLLAEAGPGPHRVFDTADGFPERFIRTDAIRAMRFAPVKNLEESANSRRTFVLVVDRTAPDRPDPDPNFDPARVYIRKLGLKPAAQTWDRGPCRLYAGFVEPYPAGALKAR